MSAAIGAQATLVGAGVLGGVVTFGALFLPGMRAVEGLAAPAPRAEAARAAEPVAAVA